MEHEDLPNGEARYERLARAVKEHTAVSFKYHNKDACLLLDVQTANLLVQVADALEKPANRAKFLNYDLGRMVETAWKLIDLSKRPL